MGGRRGKRWEGEGEKNSGKVGRERRMRGGRRKVEMRRVGGGRGMREMRVEEITKRMRREVEGGKKERK